MSNNTPNDQKYTFSELLAQYDKILVPMIQRDYAQGRSDKKATDVRSNLLNDIFSGNEVHFDLVFGSKEERSIDGKEMNCFIPVDGQQRLTTLFLLHLYGQKAGKTNTKLDLSKFSYDTRRAASDFCKSITSEEWAVPNDKNVSDVIKDSSWFMNYWEKDPTVEGMLNMLDAIHGKCKEITDYPNLDNVTFFLFDLESNGLNENLYLKMNSRGKPLTAFENLKAKIEKVLPETNKVETKWFPENNDSPKNSFKENWKFFMDRDWTEAFWDSETPEKYDESITKFIVRFLSGYWAAYGEDNEKNIADELKSFNSNENYNDFVPFEPIKAVLELDDAFPSLAYALTTVPQITPYWTNDAIKISDKSEYKFLAVIFTYVLFDGDESSMRFAWNMAENYVTGYDTFVTYCKRAGEIYKFKCNKNIIFYKALSDVVFDGNTSDQLKEEIAKVNQILDDDKENLREYNGDCKNASGEKYKTWEEIIIEAEKYAFFKGAIRFLFTDGEGNVNWKDFDKKFKNAKRYFTDAGVTKEYRKSALLLRALLSRIDIGNRAFGNYADFWHETLLGKQFQPVIHYLLTANVLQVNNKCKGWIKDNYLLEHLLETNAWWHILDDWRGYSVITRYSRRESNPNYWEEIIVLNSQRNKILQTKEISVQEGRRIKDTSYLYGWNINFSYKYDGKEYYFQWWGDPYETQCDVYLMEDEWADKVKRPDYKEGKHDKENFYCFKVTSEMEENTTQFTEELKRLIEESHK